MVEDITPAKRHGQRLLSGGATAVDGADGENVGEGRGNGCLKRLISILRAPNHGCFATCASGVVDNETKGKPHVQHGHDSSVLRMRYRMMRK